MRMRAFLLASALAVAGMSTTMVTAAETHSRVWWVMSRPTAATAARVSAAPFGGSSRPARGAAAAAALGSNAAQLLRHAPSRDRRLLAQPWSRAGHGRGDGPGYIQFRW